MLIDLPHPESGGALRRVPNARPRPNARQEERGVPVAPPNPSSGYIIAVE